MKEPIRIHLAGPLDGPLEAREELPGEWVARATVWSEDGRPVITELSIASSRGPDTWPRGGLKSRDLRTVHLDRLLRDATRQIGEMLRGEPEPGTVAEHSKVLAWGAGFFGVPPPSPPRRPGARGYPDRYWAEWALRYVKALRAGRDPNRMLADEHHLPRAFVRDTVHACRRKGFLTPAPGPGVAGGELTVKSLQVLGLKERDSAAR